MDFDPDSLLAATEHLTGFLLVITTLGLLWGLTELMGWIFAQQELRTQRRLPVPEAGPAAIASAAEPLPDDIVVVAAAVACLLDEPHRIVSVRSQQSSWGHQGRRDIHSSHRIR